MRKLIAGSLAGFGLSLLMVLDTLLPGGPRLPLAAAVVLFALVFVCFIGVMRAVGGSYFGHLPMSRVWPLVRVLPPAVKAAGAVLLAATIVNYATAAVGVTDEADFQRAFAGILSWLSAGAAILAYGVMRMERMPAEARPAESAVAGRWWKFGSLALGAAMIAFWVLIPRVSDERATHELLQTRYQGSGWVSHLVAADTSHGTFFVYLDSADPVVFGEACDSLRPYGDELGRPADLYLFDGVHQPSRIGSC
ncbi:hypothetical protein [Catellatospora citrea]|uniref:Uncharacterized protein n=1 Tax=Catellatospora citrea TaxID=53366 RepID=A0A8J3NXN3_9ACTN|nr:hypothetical protein [Catellatospora citrea]RKE11050.1 hypothetical protein C8E86_5970 [Catellatospora citrea]GIF96507.1 hypothetical protein Cci01nite_16010 [Catellatospora citrea]